MSSRERRLSRLMEDLDRDPGFRAGTRRYHRAVGDDEVADIAELLQAELDRGIKKRAELGRAEGLPVVCEVGCNHCCHEPVLVHLPEALAILRYLEADAEARSRFVAAYEAWSTAIGAETVEALAALGESESTREAYEALHLAQARKRVLCAFNDAGACTIYPVRPMVCRNAHAVETRDRCANPSLGTIARLELKPVDDFLRRAAGLLQGAHNVVAHRFDGARVNRAEALCALLRRLLA